MRTLFVTSSIDWPPRVGGEIRKWNVLQGLRQAGAVDAIVFRQEDAPVMAESFAGCGKVFEFPGHHIRMSERDRLRYSSTLGRGLLTLGTSLPYEYLGADWSELRSRIRREVDLDAYDLIWFATARAALPFGAVAHRRTVLDGDDYSYVRQTLLLASTPWYGAKLWNYLDLIKLRRWERSFPRRFSCVVRCSEEDRKLLPAANVIVVPNGTRLPEHVERAPERRVLFIGDLAYEPNAQGLEWFIERIWPLIRQRVPDAELDIIGRRPPETIQQHHGTSGIVVHGFVKDLAALFRTASVSVVPLLAGGGTRLKILESLGFGLPVVSTTVGAFGIEATPEQGLVLADAPEEFADRCSAELLQSSATDPRVQAGRDFIAAHYDWRNIQQQVASLARRVVSERSQ